MNRSRLIVPAAAACVALGISGWTGGVPSVPRSGSATPSAAAPGPNPEQSGYFQEVLIRSLAHNHGPIGPGTYFLPITEPENHPLAGYHARRAIVEVPDGYVTRDGVIIEDGSDETANPEPEGGTLEVTGAIGNVHTEPCGGGKVVDPGPSVRDLADALAPFATTAPRPVRIDGSIGLYLKIGTPEVEQCPGGVYSLWDDQKREAGSTHRLWILDVGGQRVVVLVKTLQGAAHDARTLVPMAQNLLFVSLRAPH